MIDTFVHEQGASRIVFGPGTLERVPQELARLELERVVLIVSDSLADRGERLREQLGGGLVATMRGSRAHVTSEDASAARSIVRDVEADGLVALGGGSAVGVAKAVALTERIPTVAVPTTYSGSEMTSIYGITSGDRKRTGRDDSVRPKTVVYDPLLTRTMPLHVTAGSGMNAIAHCVEALYAPDATPITSLLARDGMELLVRGLRAAIARPTDVEARADALLGACLAGTALDATTMGLHHRICHVLGGSFHVVHGDANSVVLPHVARFNAPVAPEAMDLVAKVLGGDEAPDALADFGRELGAPSRLSEIGLREEDLERAAVLVLEAPVLGPRPATVADVEALLWRAYRGAADK